MKSPSALRISDPGWQLSLSNWLVLHPLHHGLLFLWVLTIWFSVEMVPELQQSCQPQGLMPGIGWVRASPFFHDSQCVVCARTYSTPLDLSHVPASRSNGEDNGETYKVLKHCCTNLYVFPCCCSVVCCTYDNTQHYALLCSVASLLGVE